jgi:SnoaL-like domain
METWELRAREGVRETIARYAHLVDRGRIAELVELFTPDGILEAGHLPAVHGRAAIQEFLESTKGRLAAKLPLPRIRHHVSSVLIEVVSRTVLTAYSYFFVVTERGPDHWGRYRDRLVLSEGRWLFEHRRVTTDGRAPGSWTR